MLCDTNRIVLVAVTLLSLVYEGSCIYCYNCSSVENGACIEPKAYEPEVREALINVVRCEDGVDYQPPGGFFCRKLVQKIYTDEPKLDQVKIRVVRSCGWVRPDQYSHMISKDCYRDKSVNHVEIACQCFADRCNSADASSVNIMMFIMTSAVYLYFR